MFNRHRGRREMGESERKTARGMKRGSSGRRVRRVGGDSRTERGGLHSVCGEQSFLKPPSFKNTLFA